VNRRVGFTLGLYRDEPVATAWAKGHRDVFHNAQYLPAVPVAHPAKLGQEDAAIDLIELAALWVAKAIGLAFSLKPRKACAFSEEIDVGALQIFERLLQGLTW